MFKIQRRRLSTVYTKSPAQNIQRWFADNARKIFFSVFISILWLGILYVMIGVVNFVGANVAGMWSEETSTAQLYNHPYTLPVIVGGIIGVFWYVFRDPRKSR